MAVLERERETFGSVLNRLGGIPPERVVLHPVPGTATVEDVIAARLGQRKRLYELIDGVMVEKKAVSFKEGILAGEILGQIRDYLKTNRLGFVTPGDSQIEFRIGLVRIPDVSYIPWTR